MYLNESNNPYRTYSTKELARILQCSCSLLYKWRTQSGYQRPAHLKLGGDKGRVRYTDSGLYEFLLNCTTSNEVMPQTFSDFLPLLTTNQLAQLLQVKTNTIQHSPNYSGIPFFRIHPEGIHAEKGNGLIRYSTWHINQIFNQV